jgi:pimeloyl-ACP methyl ester carboxylesterase
MDRYVGDVLALLEHLCLERTAFFGYSDGARVGYSFGAAHLGRLTCLVALGAPGGKAGNREGQVMAQKYRRLGMAGLVTQIEATEGIRLPGWLKAQFLETDVEMFTLSREAWADWEGPWALAPRIRAPVLILAGELEDPDRHAAGLAAEIPRGRSAILPGLGHVGAFLRPDLVLECARPFLDKNSRG